MDADPDNPGTPKERREDDMGKSIRLAQRCEPALTAGTYGIEVQAVTDLTATLTDAFTEFTVATERFSLLPDQVYSVYPPREAVGSYTECLPHIVLNRRTLPWERQLISRLPSMPWLALLVFDETESFTLTESTCEQALKPEAGTFVPALVREAYEKPDAPCSYVQLDAKLAAGVLPYAEALALLAHGKGVSLDPKVTDASVQDEWFATIVTNRFGLEPAGDRAVRHTACLVSLEGYEACLENEQGRRQALDGCREARMIVLASWTFSIAKSPFDFASAFASLDAAMLATPYSGANETVRQLSDLGYMPMNHQVRDGSRTVSWYQPPLIPYAEPKEPLICARFADQWLSYDPEIGMMDIRFAGAWQVGRSMALADQSYAQRLYAWRQSNVRAARSAVYRGLLGAHLSAPSDEATLAPGPGDDSIGHEFVLAAGRDRRTGGSDSGRERLRKQLNERYRSLLGEGIDDEPAD